MANIWPVYEGSAPTAGEPWASLPLSEAVELFELRPADFVSDLQTIPRFGPMERNLTFAGFKHIVVEVEPHEARKGSWMAGFYKSRVRPKEAFGLLIKHALAAGLGAKNVLRISWEPASDSGNREALRISVVIAPDAIRKLESGAALDALIRVRRRLQEMHDDRVPLIEYATEAELQEGGGT